MLLELDTPEGQRPLIGRSVELGEITDVLDSAASGRGGALLLVGDSGVGKSRLLLAGRREAERRGWQTAVGRAYPVERGIPYAPFADAFVPMLRDLSPPELVAITRGGEAELAEMLPGLQMDVVEKVGPSEPPEERKTRLLWNFFEFLGRVSAKQPLLLVIDDLQWADASSLELLHFIVRQIGALRVAVLCAFNDSVVTHDPGLTTAEQALRNLPTVRLVRVDPLSESETRELVQQHFGVGEVVVRAFCRRLHSWTRGNPFFIRETLDTLVASGRLKCDQGHWTGWDLDTLDLPASIRDSVLARLSNLTARGREIADLLAVVGTSVSHDLLCRIAGVPEPDVVRAVDELRARGVIDERLHLGEVVYDFAHPVVRETLYAELGLARSRLLHTRVARAMESDYGDAALERSAELAYHYARAAGRDVGPKAVRYLAAAGRGALDRYANREAADFLSAAIELAEAHPDADEPILRLLDDLARAKQRVGAFDEAVHLWSRVLKGAEAAGDQALVGRTHRRLGLVDYWRGRYGEALDHFARGLAAARTVRDEVLEARLHLARGECLMELGSPDEAREAINAALELAERAADRALLTRVNFALLLLHTWIGPPDRAREHGEQALRLATEANNDGLRCTVQWGLVILSGLTGDGEATARHIAECEKLADRLGSPLHRLRLAEPMVEFLASTGDWELALERGEQAIATAGALNQRSILARLLVWTALIYFGRGETARGKQYVDRAWEIARIGEPGQRLDVHTAVPAHVGRVAQLIAAGEYAAAIEVGEAGLRIADRTGYTVWAIHRLLPLIAEAHLWMGDIEGAARVGERLRADSLRLGHRLGLAWADACDALVCWLQGDIARGIQELRRAAERLEAIPAVPDAARVRRHFAARLRDVGRREEALRQLRHIHGLFLRLGAEPELAKTREQIRELGARPPAKGPARGTVGLSEREREVARLAAEGKSNKTIARLLDISPRTVSTHLSNIFAKLGVASRAELAATLRGTPEPGR